MPRTVTAAQRAERERVDPHVLDPTNQDKFHTELAAELQVTSTFIRLRRNHYFPHRTWGSPVPMSAPASAAPPDPDEDPAVDDGAFDPEWAERLAARGLPAAERRMAARRVAPDAGPLVGRADRCRAWFAEWLVVAERHAGLDWSAPATERPRSVPMPERREFYRAS